MKICHIQTVLYVENQLFYVTDFFYLTSKKSVFFLTISIILSENRPRVRENFFSSLEIVMVTSNLFLRLASILGK